MEEKQDMEQEISIKDSQNITIIQAKGDVYYYPDYAETKELLPKEIEAGLKDGDQRSFSFLDIDIVDHSELYKKFGIKAIDATLLKLRNWINSIITKHSGKELGWAGDGGTFYFLQEKISDNAVAKAVLAGKEIFDKLVSFNATSNTLVFEEKHTDIQLRLGIDFGVATYHKDPGNWRSPALNTACKLQKMTYPNSLVITQNAYKEIISFLPKDIEFRQTSLTYDNQPLYIFLKEIIIDPAYLEYFEGILKFQEKEFEELSYWVNLYTIETRLISWQEFERGRVELALEVVDRCLKQNKNAIIFGESGSGKTFTLFKLFNTIKERLFQDPEETHIPLFIELSRIKDIALDQLVIQSIEEKLVNKIRYNIKDLFERDKARYIIFLDGLNETGAKKRQREVFIEIARFSRLNPQTRLFLTTQAIDDEFAKSNFELYETQPLRKDEVIEYLTKFRDKFSSKDVAEGVYAALSETMKQFISIPIFLHYFILAYKKDTIPSNIGNLMREYEDFLCGSREATRQLVGWRAEPPTPTRRQIHWTTTMYPFKPYDFLVVSDPV